MTWLLDYYILHALAALVGIAWGIKLERDAMATKTNLRVVVRMLDSDLDELREDQSRQKEAVTGVLEDIRSGVATLVEQGKRE